MNKQKKEIDLKMEKIRKFEEVNGEAYDIGNAISLPKKGAKHDLPIIKDIAKPVSFIK